MLSRFDNRKHYSFCGEKVINRNVNISEKDVCKYIRQFEVLNPEDICVRLFKINMGMKDVNPLQHVSFYTTCEGGSKIRIIKKELEEISTMMPEQA